MSEFAVHATGLSTAAVVLGVAAIALGAPALASTETSARRPPPAGAFVQQGRKLLPADPSELSHFAGTVALSGDGNTALIGAPGEGPGDSPARRGAAFMYTRSSRGTWRRVETLRADDQTPDAAFGSAVALSDDGNTALITGAGDTEGIGAAWIFTRSHGRWKQQRPKLNGVGLDLGTGSGATGFGISAALSANGNTALVGAYLDGSAFVFARSHGQWSQQGPKLPGVDAEDVALSDDGNRALIRNGTEADLFTRSPSAVWALSSRLTVCPCPAGQGQANDVSLALSGDGKTAILGDSGFNISTGAAFVFSRSPRGRWTRRVRLTVTGAEGFNPYVGNSVGLSRDGRTALIGAESDLSGVGAAWVFRRAGGRWSQQGHKLTARDESGPGAGNFASSLALSGDASTALIGGSSERQGAGAAWVFVAR